MYKYVTAATDGTATEVWQSLDELARDGAGSMVEAACVNSQSEFPVFASIEPLGSGVRFLGRIHLPDWRFQ
jgi:hypothetical protein